jgi:hypothetical protein
MGNWVGALTSAATGVVADLGAFGVLPGQASAAGGHSTTQVSINPQTGQVSQISTSNSGPEAVFSSYAGITIAALLVVIGIYLLFWADKRPAS